MQRDASARRPVGSSRRAEHWKLSSGEDLEIALRAAEDLLHRAEDTRRHEQNRGLGIWSLMVGTVLSLFASLLWVVDLLLVGDSWSRVLVAAVGTVVGVLVLLVLVRALILQRRRIFFDYQLRLASQISGMVNEAVVDVAEREGWSYLRLQTTKLRLSAFPLLDPDRGLDER